jgi:hypothetical protein
LRRTRIVSSRHVDAGVYDEPVQPGGKRRITTEMTEVRYQLQEDLLRHIARGGGIAMKEVKRNRVDAILMSLVDDTEGISVTLPAGFDNVRMYFRLTQTHRPFD